MQGVRRFEKYGTVEQKVREVVNGIPDVHYLFNNWAQANVSMDRIEGPTIIYVLPPSGELEFKWSQVKDIPSVQIAFVAPTDFDFGSEENDNIIEQMRRLCIKFVLAINESELFAKIEGRLEYRVLYDYFDQNVTGIVITPPLVEENGVILCEIERRENDE